MQRTRADPVWIGRFSSKPVNRPSLMNRTGLIHDALTFPPSVNLISLRLPPSLTVRHRPFVTAGTRCPANATPLCRAVAVFVRVAFLLRATSTSSFLCMDVGPNVLVLVALSQILR
ncbi:hypothetical protein PIB30_046567 [Stylosanthes scabra]|uniref:Uncharacterized protein n=1 Tax=Stylosanthes scabra TaxID=79078 RepID=A0ABU6WI73_9FABA|nr:hypothetical protein [Stylosanthes scabra]